MGCASESAASCWCVPRSSLNETANQVLSLLAEQGPRLHALMVRITLREDVAEDLMQELFLRLSRPHTLPRAVDPIGYAVRAATRLAFDWRRSQRRRRDTMATENEPASNHEQKPCRLEQREELQAVLDAIQQLSTVCRDIVVMRYLEGRSYDEISAIVGKTLHQTRSTLLQIDRAVASDDGRHQNNRTRETLKMKTSQRISHRLRELSELSPDPDSTQRAMTMARAAIGEAFSGDPSRQKGVNFFWPRMAIAATIAVLIVAGIVLWVAGPFAPSIAFAQVVSQVQAVKSVRYVETRSHMPRSGEPRGPTEVKQVTILGRSRMREEWTSITPGEPLPDGALWYADSSEQGIVMISDLAQGKIVTLDPKTKTLSVVRAFASMSADDGKIAVSKVAPAPEVDFFKSLQLFPAAQAEHIAAREVAGHYAIGFRTTEMTQRKQGVDTWTCTYWVDTLSKLPVQIEVTSESTDLNMGQSRWVLSDFVFDQPVDESLVSTEPPQGYAVRE